MERRAVVPYEGEREYIFISYSHRDTAPVVPVMERLSEEGYRIWYDEGIDPGSEWPETIADHLGRASACIGFISNNYLASDNCRREMNYALKKQIPYLSVMLEETEMTAGVEMQLSANQAIFKYKLPSEKAFYQKINATKFLQSSRELPAPEAPSPVPEAPAPIPETASLPEKAPTPSEKKSAAQKKPAKAQRKKETAGTKKPMKKQMKIALISIGAALALLAVLAIAIFAPNADKQPETGSPSVTETDPDAPVSEADLLNGEYGRRVFWGNKTQTKYETKDAFIKNVKYTDVALDDGTFNLSVFPYSVEVRADVHPDTIRLYYFDKAGTQYIVQGSYTVQNGTLTVSAADAVYSDARQPAQTLVYGISRYFGHIRLTSDAQLAASFDYCCSENALSGAADAVPFGEIEAIDIPEPGTGKACSVRFTDGGSTHDATLDTYYGDTCSIRLMWTKTARLYNGAMADFDVSDTCSFYFINTYPYGFILINNKDGVYFYQKPISDGEQVPDSTDAETESAPAEETDAAS